MSTMINSISEKTFGSFKKITPALVAVAIITGLLLFLPESVLAKMSLNALPDLWKRIIGIIFLLSVALICTISILIIPIYVNEKIVLDMLAILEDGFSKVSQINYIEKYDNVNSQSLQAGVGTSGTVLNKLLKIDFSGEIEHNGDKKEENNVLKEKVHTNTSLLSKFRDYLVQEKLLKTDINILDISAGDFVEVEGKIEKNPLINYLEIILNVFRLTSVFEDTAVLGEKNQAKKAKQEEKKLIDQIKQLLDELKSSKTIDYIISNDSCSVVLSAQEQYLENDNTSEIIGGSFKVLGKVISVCKNADENIDLLRKTTLSILPETLLQEIFSGFKEGEIKQYNLPKFVTKLEGPAIMVLPIAIYA